MRLIDADELKRRLNGWYDPYHKGCDEIQIDTLLDMIDEESTVFGWISVKDRLPEKGVEVLVWSWHTKLTRVWTLDEGGVWEDEYGYLQDFEDVTHWMPIPPTPEGGKDD